jgi:vancomycin resistance protein YoaR
MTSWLEPKIPQGTKVDELDLSGLTFSAGRENLQAWAEAKLAETCLLVYNDNVVAVSLQELGLDLDLEKTWSRVTSHPGVSVASVLDVDAPKIAQLIENKLPEAEIPAKDAAYRIAEDKFIIIPAVSGHVPDIDSLTKELKGLSFVQIPAKLVLAVSEVPAKITTEAVQALAFDTVIAEYSTAFSTLDGNRVNNLTLAARSLDKKEIVPGDTFSFNETVGPRTAERGYKEARIILNNEFVYGFGGGVCQVSTTLYNSVLLADLPVAQRSPHSLPVSYVPLGRDATVSYPAVDLKFRNNTAGILYLRTAVNSGVITIRIWGKKSNKTVRLLNEIEQVIEFQTETINDPELPAGETVVVRPGSNGYIVKTWRLVREESGSENKEFLSRDIYSPVNQILKVGSKEYLEEIGKESVELWLASGAGAQGYAEGGETQKYAGGEETPES